MKSRRRRRRKKVGENNCQLRFVRHASTPGPKYIYHKSIVCHIMVSDKVLIDKIGFNDIFHLSCVGLETRESLSRAIPACWLFQGFLGQFVKKLLRFEKKFKICNL